MYFYFLFIYKLEILESIMNLIYLTKFFEQLIINYQIKQIMQTNINSILPEVTITKNQLTSLDIFEMKRKLGLKPNISISDLANFKRIDPLSTGQIKVTPSPIEKLKELRLRQLRMWVWLGVVFFIMEDFLELYYRKSNWLFVAASLELILIGFLLSTYIPNLNLKKQMLPTSILVNVRLNYYLLMSIIFEYSKKDGEANTIFLTATMMIFCIKTYLVSICFLMLIQNLYNETKRITLITYSLAIIGLFLLINNIISKFYNVGF